MLTIEPLPYTHREDDDHMARAGKRSRRGHSGSGSRPVRGERAETAEKGPDEAAAEQLVLRHVVRDARCERIPPIRSAFGDFLSRISDSGPYGNEGAKAGSERR